jgi:hypothetical protein
MYLYFPLFLKPLFDILILVVRINIHDDMKFPVSVFPVKRLEEWEEVFVDGLGFGIARGLTANHKYRLHSDKGIA